MTATILFAIATGRIEDRMEEIEKSEERKGVMNDQKQNEEAGKVLNQKRQIARSSITHWSKGISLSMSIPILVLTRLPTDWSSLYISKSDSCDEVKHPFFWAKTTVARPKKRSLKSRVDQQCLIGNKATPDPRLHAPLLHHRLCSDNPCGTSFHRYDCISPAERLQ